MKRTFQIVHVQNRLGKKVKINEGRYVSEFPVGAAKKVYSQVLVHTECTRKNKSPVFTIVIKETAAGSSGKVYVYKVHRETIDPVLVPGSTERPAIIYKYKVITKAVDPLKIKGLSGKISRAL